MTGVVLNCCRFVSVHLQELQQLANSTYCTMPYFFCGSDWLEHTRATLEKQPVEPQTRDPEQWTQNRNLSQTPLSKIPKPAPNTVFAPAFWPSGLTWLRMDMPQESSKQHTRPAALERPCKEARQVHHVRNRNLRPTRFSELFVFFSFYFSSFFFVSSIFSLSLFPLASPEVFQ